MYLRSKDVVHCVVSKILIKWKDKIGQPKLVLGHKILVETRVMFGWANPYHETFEIGFHDCFLAIQP